MLTSWIWSDWKKKSATVIAGMLLTWLTGVAGYVGRRVVAINALPEVVEAHHAETAIQAKQYEQLRTEQMQQGTILNQLYRQSRTFTGSARNGDYEGDPSAQINVLGDANGYQSWEKIRVTNLSSRDSQSLVLSVDSATFKNEDSFYLIRLSRSAASKLAFAGQEIRVRIEPVK